MWLKDTLPRQELQSLLDKLIERVPVFAGFTQGELLELLSGAEKRVFKAGDEIIREGSSGKFMYVLIDGQARVSKRGDGFRARDLAELARGDCFGEMTLVDNAPRSATVKAETACILIRIQESDCWNNTKAGSKIYRNIAGILSQRVRELHAQLLEKERAAARA